MLTRIQLRMILWVNWIIISAGDVYLQICMQKEKKKQKATNVERLTSSSYEAL